MNISNTQDSTCHAVYSSLVRAAIAAAVSIHPSICRRRPSRQGSEHQNVRARPQANKTANAATALASSASAGPARAALLDVVPLEVDPDPVLEVVPDVELESAVPLGVPTGQESERVSTNEYHDGREGSYAPVPPATVDSCANPTDAGEERKTEYTFFY